MSEGVFKNPFDVIDDDGEDEIQQSLPQEIEQALKKIAKRDGTTRAKGFSELLDHLKRCEDGEISSISVLMRGAFVKIFKKFLLCAERGSRFAVSELTHILILKSDAKEFLQPILKEILSPWLLSLFDPAQEVSTLQRKTLENVFPAGTKLKLLLERFEKQILSEISEYAKSEEKFSELKEIILNEMDGTVQEVEIAVELIKTEMIGVLSLFLLSFSAEGEDDKIKALLFLKDKAISSPRRCSLYRFSLKFQQNWLIKAVYDLLAKETSPSALGAALELLDKTENMELLRTLQRETFTVSFLSNAPVAEFKKFAAVLVRKEEIRLLAAGWFINICNANNIMNKERFLSFWRDIAIVVFKDCSDRLVILENLMFPNTAKTSRISNVLTAIVPLTADETIQCLLEGFSAEEMRSVCKGRISPQSAFALSFINETVELEKVLSALSLSELQNSKELMRVLPEEVLTRRLIESVEGESLSVSEIVRLIQSLPVEKAVKVLEGRKFNDWEKLLKSSLLTRGTVKNVLFRIERFRQYARDQLDNLLIISCALESEIKIFETVPDVHAIEEALVNVVELEIRSPLLKLCIKMIHDHPKIMNLAPEKMRKLFGFIELQKDAELFVAFDCGDEEFYPIEYIERVLEEQSAVIPTDPIEIVLFKAKPVEFDWILSKLVSFPLKSTEKQILVAKCAFLNNFTDLIGFEIPISAFNSPISDFDSFCMSKVVESKCEISEFEDPKSFKEAVLLYSRLSAIRETTKINEIIDKIIFDESSECSLLPFALCLEPVLPIRSDNLAGLISKVKEDFVLLLLLASKHLDREEVKKEFWQVQFRERFRAILKISSTDGAIEKELKTRVAGGIWDKLTDPEIELLDDCNFKEPLENVFEVFESEGCWESFGLARLVLMAAPFMEKSFALDKLVDYYNSEAFLVTPAMELALRSVYLQLHLDEQLVAASVKIDSEMELDDMAAVIFPFYGQLLAAKDKKFAVLLEMFVSAAEGSREDPKLLAAFADVFKTRILPILVGDHVIEGTLEEFDFVPRDFDARELIEHVVHRLCAIFPLIIAQSIPRGVCARSQEVLQQREIERIRRQPRICVESVEILLKPILTSTTRLINLRVKFLDEIELSIDLNLPTNFPLEAVRVEGKEKSGLAESKWKSALLSLQSLLRSATFSGNLIEAIKKWQANALKLFQGLEECAVCYSVLHASDKSLPGPACKQCKHKFHATCLYKWFKSSGNATCPLCRALF